MSRATFSALWFGCVLTAQLVEAADTRQDLERIAAALPVFDRVEFACNRHPRNLTKDIDAKYRQLIVELTTTNHKVDDLVVLLKHADPKVRTLAAAALFAREDPKLLPHLFALVNDQAETLPTIPRGAGTIPGRPYSFEPQKVGDCIERFLGVYVSAAFIHGDGKRFPDYWKTRMDREYCASWFAVKVQRALGFTHPVQEDRKEAIHAVRLQIDALPQADRIWTLLALYYEETEGVLVSDAELVAMCKELGPEALMSMLQHKIPSDYPDLQWSERNGYYASMIGFVLRHATELLRPEDAATLLDRSTGNPRMIDWVVAAAALKPSQAKELLLGASQLPYPYNDGGEKAPAAMWRLVGPSENEFLVDWFYRTSPEMAHFPHVRARFLREVRQYREADIRRLLAALIADQRFDTLDWQSLDELVRTVNQFVDEPVVTQQGLRAVWHPFGEGRFYWQQDAAKAKYPKETAELLKNLDQWRVALREVAKEWGK